MLRYMYAFLSIGVLVCSQKVYKTIIDRTTFLLYTGYPRQELHAIFSIELSNTIFLDNTCGVKPQNCPRYCNDVFFATTYCETVCQFQYATKDLVCTFDQNDGFDSYYLSNSKTFKLLNKSTWNSRTWFTDLLSGQLFTDKLVLIGDINDSYHNLEIKTAVMVRGMMLDEMLFETNGVMVGFGPGENNIIVQLYAQNLIPSPVALFNFDLMGASLFKIGDYNDESCINWTKHVTQDKDRWVLEVQDLELNGVKYHRKLKALITNHAEFISLPPDFLNKLLKANVLKQLNKTESLISRADFYFDCKRPLKLHVTIDGRELTIPNDLLQDDDPPIDNVCITLFKRHDSMRYNFELSLLLGWPFLNEFCISFDYSDEMTIRLAEHAKRNLGETLTTDEVLENCTERSLN
ncbi:hypothetical protein M3Y98_00094500 [Aphelenchoides besseyi]|nr:hypothetical protein M3Y98_00094500 [Aphelenchoides besseyi]KAI6198547.1 hypothetical protein M3Y96_00530800 [Aphelenchoides besseyi]